MNILEIFRVALQSVRVNALRSILTALGIIIGVAAVLTMVGIGAGAQKAVEEINKQTAVLQKQAGEVAAKAASPLKLADEKKAAW